MRRRGLARPGREGRRGGWVWFIVAVTVLALVNPIVTLAIPIVVAARELTRPGMTRVARWASATAGGGVLVALVVVVATLPGMNVVMDEPLDDVIGVIAAVALCLPLAAAVTVLAARAWTTHPSGDGAQRVVTSMTSGLPRRRAEWAAAMRAELAAIQDRHERRRFALGCVVVVMRWWLPARVWLSAAALGATTAGISVAATTLAVSTGRRDWTVVPVLLWVALVVATFVAAATTAWRQSSYRAGVIAGSSVLVIPAVTFFAVTVPGLREWYTVSGVSISGNPLPSGAGLAFPWTWVVLSLVVWTACPIIGASAGDLLPGRRHPAPIHPTDLADP